MSTTDGPSLPTEVQTPFGRQPVLQAVRDEQNLIVPPGRKLADGAGPGGALEIGGNVSSIWWGFTHWITHGGGVFITTDSIPGVNRFSQVSVSITEVDTNNDFPFVGSAALFVYNVAPHDGGTVTVAWGTGWESSIHVRLNYIVVN